MANERLHVQIDSELKHAACANLDATKTKLSDFVRGALQSLVDGKLDVVGRPVTKPR